MTGTGSGGGHRERLIAELQRRAPAYVPEWQFRPDQPDAGSALALLWAGMFAETHERYDRIPENYRRALLDVIGSAPRQALPARGYLCFAPQEDTAPAIIPEGFGVASAEDAETVLQTDRQLALSHNRLLGILHCDAEQDSYSYRPLADSRLPSLGKAEAALHTLTFFHPFAMDVPSHTNLTLQLSTQPPLSSQQVHAMRWQCLCGEDWQGASVVDVQGDRISLRMPDSMSGACTALRLGWRDGNHPLRIHSVAIYPARHSIPPDAVYAGDTQLSDAGGHPFGQRFLPYDSLYFACSEALSKPSAQVELSFSLRMLKFPIEGYPAQEILWKRIMDPEDLEPPATYEITVAEVVWEYFNGTGWATLPVEHPQASAIFAQGGDKPQHIALRFRCPDDIQPTVQEAHTAPFVRARILHVDNLYQTNGHFLSPWIESSLFRYVCPDGYEVADVLMDEYGESRNVRLPASVAVQPMNGEAVCLAWERPLDHGSLLFEMAQCEERPALLWEYWTQNGWSPLEVLDETRHLGRTGVLSYQITAPSASTTLCGVTAWWMRARPATYGISLHLLPWKRYYLNAVPATARVAGTTGNLPAASFTTLLQPAAGVAGVTNPLMTGGGCAEEDEGTVIRRLTSSFSHNGRAVSQQDMEELAREASLDVLKCRCLPSRNPAGQISETDTCLVVLRRGNPCSQEEFEPLRRMLETYLEERMSLVLVAGRKLHILQPHYTKVHIQLVGVVEELAQTLAIRQALIDTLAVYLDPLTGGPDGAGWQIGQLPSPAQVSRVVWELPELAGIRSLTVRYGREGSGFAKSYTAASQDCFAYPVAGECDAVLMVR